MQAGPALPVATRQHPPQHVFASWQELALLLICAAILAFQVFIPPYIGLADNGDFGKITLRFSLRPLDPDYWHKYFNADYVRSARYHWESEFRSSEILLAKLAFYLSRTEKEGDLFNVRWLGAVHVTLFLIAFYLLLVATRPLSAWARMLMAVAAIWIFTDVSYVSYFNSFYSDTAALLGVLGVVVLAVLISTKGWRLPLTVALFLFAVLLIASKPQHAPLAFLPAVFLFVASWRDKRRAVRVVGAGMGALLLATSFVVIRMTPWDQRGNCLFDVIFHKLPKNSRSPVRDLEALGLSQKELPYVGLWAYHAQSPTADQEWFHDFCRRTSYSKLAGFYLTRPARVLAILRDDLEVWAPWPRGDVANYRRQDATKPNELATRFASWSELRCGLLRRWPYHIVVWYALVAAGVVLVLRARPSPVAVRMAWITAGVAAAGIAEFCVSSLADACETARHLFLFHTLTDITVCLALAAVLSGTLRASLRRSG